MVNFFMRLIPWKSPHGSDKDSQIGKTALGKNSLIGKDRLNGKDIFLGNDLTK